MKTVDDIHDFLNGFVSWASAQEDVQAIALVGSYARGEARDDSDIDLVLLTDQPQTYVEDVKWLNRFGTVTQYQTEDYGKLISTFVDQWLLHQPHRPDRGKNSLTEISKPTSESAMNTI